MTRKTRDEFIVQGSYGQGWEDVTAEDFLFQARCRLREYRENEPQYPHRLIKRRIKIDKATGEPSA